MGEGYSWEKRNSWVVLKLKFNSLSTYWCFVGVKMPAPKKIKTDI